MRRRAFRSRSLLPCEPSQDPAHQCICNSAPSQVIPGQEEDWDWGSLEATNESSGTLLEGCALGNTDDAGTDGLLEDDRKPADKDTRDIGLEGVFSVVQIALADSKQSVEGTGGFTDFINPVSPDSTENNVQCSDSDEPDEYWGKAWSYSRSPFSNCSSLSYEDSDDDGNVTVHSRVSPIEVSSDTLKDLSPLGPSPNPTPKPTRFSDVGPSVMRGLTAIVHGTTTFKGPTSI
ncbi:hypothetical protein ON010_g15460 [Phytophthora cinnamomi]|nr:hypothetical protein ON010_g15460 [Phytophthora cinnamomi]